MIFNFLLAPNGGVLQNIYLTIKIVKNDKIFNFCTSLKISEKDWDNIKGRPSNLYRKHDKRLNEKLDLIKKNLAEYLLEQNLEKRIPLQSEMHRRISTICSEYDDTEHSPFTFLNYMLLYIETKRDHVCHSTYKRYKVFYKLFSRFEGYALKKYDVKDIDLDFVKKFIAFGKEESYNENTINRTIHFIKTILIFAERKGVRTSIRDIEVRREKHSGKLITLDDQDLLKIIHTPLPERLLAAKNWLLISCYTGQRFSDFMRFNTENLSRISDKLCLAFTQKKTNKDILLPLHPIVLRILEDNNGCFPEVLSLQSYNNQIKEIAFLANLREPIRAKKRMNFRSHETSAEKWEVLTSHIGRRSFATNFYGKIPTPLLISATGHSTEQMFLNYINIMDKERVLTLSDHFEQNYQEIIKIDR